MHFDFWNIFSLLQNYCKLTDYGVIPAQKSLYLHYIELQSLSIFVDWIFEIVNL